MASALVEQAAKTAIGLFDRYELLSLLEEAQHVPPEVLRQMLILQGYAPEQADRFVLLKDAFMAELRKGCEPWLKPAPLESAAALRYVQGLPTMRGG